MAVPVSRLWDLDTGRLLACPSTEAGEKTMLSCVLVPLVTPFKDGRLDINEFPIGQRQAEPGWPGWSSDDG
jgi:hypothetical protein